MDLKEPKQYDKENEVQSQTDLIAHGHPPKQHQFKKGQSGNLKGRPKKPPKSHDLLWEELRRPIKLKIKGKETSMMRLEAMLLQLMSHAVNGDRRAMNIYLERVAKARWRKNGYKVEEEEAIDLPWTPEMEKLYQSINWDDEGKAACDADEDKPTAPASPDNAPQAHKPVTIPTQLKENDHA